MDGGARAQEGCGRQHSAHFKRKRHCCLEAPHTHRRRPVLVTGSTMNTGTRGRLPRTGVSKGTGPAWEAVPGLVTSPQVGFLVSGRHSRGGAPQAPSFARAGRWLYAEASAELAHCSLYPLTHRPLQHEAQWHGRDLRPSPRPVTRAQEGPLWILPPCPAAETRAGPARGRISQERRLGLGPGRLGRGRVARAGSGGGAAAGAGRPPSLRPRSSSRHSGGHPRAAS